MTTYIEIHALQSMPPANLNRDQDGMPKTCVFGSKTRSRVSSQCWKRAIRQWYRQHAGVTEQNLAERSRGWYMTLRDMLVERQHELGDAENMARMALGVFGVSLDENDRTNMILFLGRTEVEAIATLLHDNWATIEPVLHSDKSGLPKEILNAVEKTVSRDAKPGDVGLFGRMMAKLSIANVDAAVQVAHAISTNAAEQEFDYFTAVDDLASEETTWGDHIGETGFSSSVFYRYANVSVDQLAQNLGDRAGLETMLRGFLMGFVKSIPSGHQNGFAAHSLPALVLLTVRHDQPVSLVDAFESPARAQRGSSLLEDSVRKLAHHWVEMDDMYGSQDRAYSGMAIRSSLLEHSGNLSAFRVEGGVDAVVNSAIARALEESA